MSKSLAVYLNERFVGILQQDMYGKNSFTYNTSYLQSSNPIPISNIMPLQTEPYDHNTCHVFFAGILPEDSQRKIIARCLGISANNDFSLLEKIGGECAGAISILPMDKQFTIKDYEYKYLAEHYLHEVLQELPRRPLLAGEKDIRLSLAGVQDKLPVAVFDNKIYLPLNGAPSTHILKPSITGYPFDTVFNEAFCLKLAKQIGLNVADADIGHAKNIKYLLVTRYDRKVDGNKIIRLHQEDFCQALNVAPELKYQNEGGPSLRKAFDLVRNTSTDIIIDISNLLDAVVYNFIIGNCDAHGKNFSLLYKGAATRFAPLYDLLSTIIYPELSSNMAMKIGNQYNIHKVTKHDFTKLAQDCGLNVSLTLKRALEICSIIDQKINDIELMHDNFNPIYSLIKTRVATILDIFL